MKSLSDQELMRLVQAGDFSPASEIYDRYSSRIYNFAYRFLRNSEAAEDAAGSLCQDAEACEPVSW